MEPEWCGSTPESSEYLPHHLGDREPVTCRLRSSCTHLWSKGQRCPQSRWVQGGPGARRRPSRCEFSPELEGQERRGRRVEKNGRSKKLVILNLLWGTQELMKPSSKIRRGSGVLTVSPSRDVQETGAEVSCGRRHALWPPPSVSEGQGEPGARVPPAWPSRKRQDGLTGRTFHLHTTVWSLTCVWVRVHAPVRELAFEKHWPATQPAQRSGWFKNKRYETELWADFDCFPEIACWNLLTCIPAAGSAKSKAA